MPENHPVNPENDAPRYTETEERVFTALYEHQMTSTLRDSCTCGAGDMDTLQPSGVAIQRHRRHLARVLVDVIAADQTPVRLGSCCVSVGTDDCACENPTNWFDNIGKGLCPACREFKFIGHGPLCIDCFQQRTSPGEASVIPPGEGLTEDSFCGACSHLLSGPPHPGCIKPEWHAIQPE